MSLSTFQYYFQCFIDRPLVNGIGANGQVQFQPASDESDEMDPFVKRFQKNMSSTLHGKLYLEVENYFKIRDCRVNSSEAVSFNPTFLQPTTGKWIVPSACPFDGYLPLPLKELEEKNGTILDYCRGVLKKRLIAFRERKKDVKFCFHLGDAMDFCYEDSPLKFDLIDTSTLADDVGLANLLNAAPRKLRSNESVLFTESFMRLDMLISAEQYLNEMLCCPLSLIPTIYGLRLKDNIGLGSEMPPPFLVANTSFSFFRLFWMKALPFEGVSLVLSQTLEDSLDRLKTACFTVPTKVPSNLWKICGISRYSPLTFCYVVSDMIRRGSIQNSTALMSKMFHAPRPVFRQELETIQAWMKNRPVWRVKISIPFKSAEEMWSLVKVCSPILRAILLPFSAGVFDMNSQNNHIIDNIDFVVVKKSGRDGEIGHAQLSFLLQDKKILKTHRIVVVEMDSLQSVCSVGDLRQLKRKWVELFNGSYPCPMEPSPLASGSFSEPRLVAESCEESDEGYTIRFKMRSASGGKSNATLKGILKKMPIFNCVSLQRLIFL